MLDALFVLIHQRVVSFTPDFFFFFNDTATTEIYTLSLHDALPISRSRSRRLAKHRWRPNPLARHLPPPFRRRWRLSDRKSTRLNSSHSQISYAVFCLKKKKIHVIVLARMLSPPYWFTPAMSMQKSL